MFNFLIYVLVSTRVGKKPAFIRKVQAAGFVRLLPVFAGFNQQPVTSFWYYAKYDHYYMMQLFSRVGVKYS